MGVGSLADPLTIAPATCNAAIQTAQPPDLQTYLRVGCSRPTVHLETLASPDTAEHLGEAVACAEVLNGGTSGAG